MTAENPGTVIIKRRFDFSIERVFDAWLDPAKASKFLLALASWCATRGRMHKIGG